MARRGRDDATDEFDDYDPTPYGGGYDLTLTFGRALPPSEETCYSISSSSGVDYDPPHYSSGSVSSAFGGGDYDTPECGYSDAKPKPKPQPAYGFQPQHEVEEGESGGYGGFGGRRPQPNPGYVYSGNQEYGGGRPNREDESENGSGYGGGRPKREEESECGSGNGGGRPKRDEYGYDRPKPYGEEGAGQGYGYGSGSKYQGGGEYGYGGGQSYQGEEHSYSSKPSYQRPSYGGEEEIGRYNKPSKYDQGEEYGRPSYGNSGYDPDQGEGYGRPSYGHGGIDYGEEKKHRRHHHRYTDDE